MLDSSGVPTYSFLNAEIGLFELEGSTQHGWRNIDLTSASITTTNATETFMVEVNTSGSATTAPLLLSTIEPSA